MTTSLLRSDTGLSVFAAVYPTPATMFDQASGEVIDLPDPGGAAWLAALVPVAKSALPGRYALALPAAAETAERVVDWYVAPDLLPQDAVATDALDVRLAADALDHVDASELAAKPQNFRQWLLWLVAHFRRADKTPGALLVKTEAGATITTQTCTDDGEGNQTLGAPE